MGFPMSRFSMMAGLCSKDSGVVEKFSQYKLICIVLHDPDDHSFKSRMKEKFIDLHERTGRDMLFITFVDPPDGFHIQYRTLDFNNKERTNLFVECDTDDKVVIGNFLRSVAPDCDLPTIIVTESLSSSHFVIIPTSSDSFADQLISIGNLCSSNDKADKLADLESLSEIDGLNNTQTRFSKRPLATELADCLALSEVGKIDSCFREEAEKWAETRLESLKHEVDQAPDEERSSASVAVYCYENALRKAKACKKEGSVISSYSHRNDFAESPKVCRHTSSQTFYMKYKLDVSRIRGFSRCHCISRDDIILYNDYLSRFLPVKRPSEDQMKFVSGGIRRDYMPLVHFFTHFLETEINLSLVQQMRQGCGIEMPEWYNKYKPRFRARVQTGELRREPQYISVNSDKEHNGVLQPLMLGKAYYAYRNMSDPGANPGIPREMGNSFLDKWNRIIEVRNPGEHTALPSVTGEGEYERLDFEDFCAVYEAFSSILSEDLLKLLDIKTELMGNS